MQWVWWVYLAVGPVAWAALWLGLVLARARMGRLRQPIPALPAPPPSVSIVVPAKDEAGHIENCVDRLLGQDYPSFEVVVIDDRSTDGTHDLLLRMAEPDGARSRAATRLRVLHVDQLPEGWLGKCHALHVGTRELDSEWILFVDSDVALEPGALRSAVALSAGRGYDALSIITRVRPRTFWERVMIPLLGATWATMFTVSLTNDDNRPWIAAANGQFFLIRRGAYEKVGGHAAVRNEIVEDVELMRRLKSAKFKCRFMIGSHLASTTMHATLGELKRGWGRIFSGTACYRRWRIYAAIAFFIVSVLGVYPMLGMGLWRGAALGDWGWLTASGIHFALMTCFLGYIYRAAGCRWSDALLVPVSAPVAIGLLVEGLRRCRDRKFEWRGTAVTIR